MEFKRKAHLVYGEIQSGKTKYTLEKCREVIQNNYLAVIILINKNCCVQQLKQRIYLFNKNSPFQITFDAYSKNIKSDAKCIISLYNSSKLSNLKVYLKDKNYVLFCDEADDHIKLKANAYEHYKELLENAQSIYYITATTYRVLFNDIYLKCDDIHILIPSKNYVSIKDVKFKIDNNIRLPNSKKREYFIDTDTTFPKYIKKLSKKRFVKIRNEENECHPIICLYKSNSDNNQIHSDIFEYMKENHKDWITIIYNGSRSRFSNTIKFFLNREREFDGTLNELLSFIKDRFYLPHILIISGRYADRMITFASEDFRWHLSHLRLSCSKNTNCVSLLQQCRILGDFPTVIEKEIICTQNVKENILNSYNLQKEILDNLLNKKNESKDCFQTLKTITVEEKVPDRKLDSYVDKAIIKNTRISDEKFSFYRIDVTKMKKNTDVYKITKLAIKYFLENNIQDFIERKDIVQYIANMTGKSENNIRGVLSYDKKSYVGIDKVEHLSVGYLFIKKKENRDKYYLLYLN